MATVPCPSCGKNLNIPEQYLGKKVKCPSCKEVLTAPAAEEPEVVAPVEVTPVRSSARRREPEPVADDDYDRPRRRPRDDDDDDRPRRRRRSRAAEWAPCPHCGAEEATRVHWTFWGGWIGPLLINQVRCNDCGTNFNGKHGDYNTTRILIYFGVSALIGVIVVVGLIAVAAINNS